MWRSLVPVTVEPQTPGDEGASGFFRRNRLTRLVVGVIVSVVLIGAYLVGVQSYRAGLAQALPEQIPPAGGVAVVIVPERMSPDEQEVPAQVLLFPSGELLDSAGMLTQELEVRIQPALSGQTLIFPAGEATAPQALVLPAAGTVQEYPFDTYDVSADVQVHSLFADGYEPVTTQASMFFRVPGWSAPTATPSIGVSENASVSTQIARDWSTKSIAILLLLLMVVLAAIAILVTGSSTRGRMKLELSVASWMTALLFALIPLRGFFPGSPPLGSWMDVLVFFWVELILMLSVAAVVTTILLRASDARHHPEEKQ
jgi:hypothetical protein